MKLIKRVLALLLCAVMLAAYIPVSGYAASGAPNISMIVDKTEANVGDTITVTLRCSDMTVGSFAAGIRFDTALLECTKVIGGRTDSDRTASVPYLKDDLGDWVKCTSMSKPAEANTTGSVGFVYANTEDWWYVALDFITATFTVKAEGEVTFTAYEQSDGTDGFIGDVEQKSVTIKEAAPACDHVGKTYTYETNNNGTHKVKCECGEYVNESESCDGSATCTALAKCSKCKAEYGNLGDHAYGNLVPATPPVHKQDKLEAGVDAHYFCDVCDTYFTESKVETTLEELTGETPVHTFGDWQTDDSKHWKECSCGLKSEEGAHTGGTATCTEKAKCSVCGTSYGDKEAHGYANGFRYTSDGAGSGTHTKYCRDCGVAIEGEKNVGCSDKTTKDHKCDACGYVMSQCADGNNDHKCDVCGETLSDHSYNYDCDKNCNVCGQETRPNAAHESNAAYACVAGQCKYCQTAMPAAANHTPEADDGDCTTDITCSVCGTVTTKGNANHTGGEATCTAKAKCNLCGKEYGELAPNNHKNPYIGTVFHSDGNGNHYQWRGCSDCKNAEIEKVNEAPCSDETTKDHKCDACGYEMSTCSDKAGDGNHNCDVCGKENVSGHSYGSATCDTPATCSECGATTGEALGHSFVDYVSNSDATCETDGTETAKCSRCDTTDTRTDEGSALGHIDENKDHKCDRNCGKADMGEHKDSATDNDHVCDYGCKEVLEACSDKASDGNHNCDVCGKADVSEHSYGNATCDAPATCSECGAPNGTALGHVDENKDHKCDRNCGKNTSSCVDSDKNHECDYAGCKAAMGEHKSNAAYPCQDGICEYCKVAMPATEAHTYENGACVCGAKLTGWEGKVYYENGNKVNGWKEVEGAWYYFGQDGYTTGAARVPYQTAAKYPYYNEDKAYADKKGNTFADVELAWYLFAENGVLSSFTGIQDGRYYVNGMAYWHPGFVQVEGEWYYFVGDADKGGNKMANGQIYVTRNAEAAGYKTSDQIVFVNGKVDTTVNGIVAKDNVLYYYENGKLMVGAGLIEIEECKYIYVRSAGQLAMGSYYLPKGLELAHGLYNIDANGYIINPMYSDFTGIKDGYYYVNGKLNYAGLIKIGEDVYYVRSNCQVATGTYWVTKTNGMMDPDKYEFGADGKMLQDGVYEATDGTYFYCKNGQKQIGTGVVKLEDEQGVYYIYVCSNGQLATGKYWPTKLNNLLPRGQYDWGTDGKYYPGK